MTTNSVEDLRAELAETLAAKFTSPRMERDADWNYHEIDTPADRVDRGMGVVFDDTDGHKSIRMVTPAEAVDALMPIIDRLRRERDHAADAAQGSSEGIRLWMLDCGALVEKYRDQAKRVAAVARKWQHNYRPRPGGGDAERGMTQAAVLTFAEEITQALVIPDKSQA